MKKKWKDQEGLDDNTIREILQNKDIMKIYKILMQSCTIFYHLTGINKFETEEEFCKAYPFALNLLDIIDVVVPLVEKFAEQGENIW